MTVVDPLSRAWSDGRTTLGAWVMLPGQVGAGAMAGPGIDVVCIDLQHGALGVEELRQLVPAVVGQGAVAVARVEKNDEATIGRALDAGAAGVVVPLVDDAEGARRAVAACRFPPAGVRSYGPTHFGVVNAAWEPEDVEAVACIVMIETAAGLAAADEIAAIPGLAGILIGPSDLAIALGVAPALAHEDATVQDAITRIHAAATRAGVVSGIVCGSGTIARPYVEAGMRLVFITTDLGLLLSGLAEEVRIVRDGRSDAGADADVEAAR